MIMSENTKPECIILVLKTIKTPNIFSFLSQKTKKSFTLEKLGSQELLIIGIVNFFVSRLIN